MVFSDGDQYTKDFTVIPGGHVKRRGHRHSRGEEAESSSTLDRRVDLVEEHHHIDIQEALTDLFSASTVSEPITQNSPQTDSRLEELP